MLFTLEESADAKVGASVKEERSVRERALRVSALACYVTHTFFFFEKRVSVVPFEVNLSRKQNVTIVSVRGRGLGMEAITLF